MGKRKIDEESQKRRPFITLMSKFRATQTLGATLSTKGNHQRASNLYKKLINDALQLREHLTVQQQRNLEKALAGVEGNTNDDIQGQAWKMRSAIDVVYDECISDYNEVSCAMPSNLQSVIKEVINSASTCIAEGDFTKGLSEYATILRQLKNNRKYKDSTSVVCQRIVDEALQAVDSDDTIQVKVYNLRNSLDLIYNEIRLPDVFSPSIGPLQALKKVDKWKANQGVLMVDFRQKDGSIFDCDYITADDQVMGGSSEAHTVLDEDDGYLRFSGKLSRSNRGGFASFRIVPQQKEELKKLLLGTKAVSLEVMNLHATNIRYKFQMANEAHLKSFNWQAEFVVEPDNEFHTVVLDIYSFWPTMFGHVLSSPGNVDFSKVDFLGVLISHVTVDGKSNPDFHEGPFGLAVRSMRFIKEDDEDCESGQTGGHG